MYETIERAVRDGHADRTVPDLCRRTLTEIAEGRRVLTAVRHPLGFICLPVLREGRLGVCVHLWSPELAAARSTTSQVHSHSWELTSYILYGQLCNCRIDLVDDPHAATHRVFELHSHGDLDEIVATPRLVRHVERFRQTAGPGEVDRLPAGEFHTTWPVGPHGAATVVLGRTCDDRPGPGTAPGGAGPCGGRPPADLSLGPPDTPGHRLTRQRCVPAETARAAAIVIRGLDRGHVHGE